MEAFHALTFSPTLNIQGLWSGLTDPRQPKTIMPAEAHARIDIRLVPDQDPTRSSPACGGISTSTAFADIRDRRSARRARVVDAPDHPLVAGRGRASEAVAGGRRSVGCRCPGTVPMYQVCARHGVPATTLGAARDDCRAHAPDENVRLDDLATATRITPGSSTSSRPCRRCHGPGPVTSRRRPGRRAAGSTGSGLLARARATRRARRPRITRCATPRRSSGSACS